MTQALTHIYSVRSGPGLTSFHIYFGLTNNYVFRYDPESFIGFWKDDSY